ncbi:MAG TPA: PAS-domain containing protein [Rhodocyclaceae bacterium]|nr:PAS-domain containing protein [Rhodocyclaceae bacterium]
MNEQPTAGQAAAFADHALQEMIDFLPSGVTRFDRDLNMVMCNRQFRELLDFPDTLFEDGLPSLQQLAIFNAERGEYGAGDPQVLATAVVERARRREAHVFERARPDGRILEIRGNPLPDGGFVTIYTDITERKRAEEDARRAASYLDAVVNALPQGVTVVDEALNLVLWNPAFIQIQDLPDSLMKPGVTFPDVIRFNAERGEYGAVDPDEKVRQMVELARRFEPHRLERTRGDGGVLEVEGRIVVADGRTLGFVTTYNDITERVRNERTIRHVRDLMSEAVNFSPTYIWETDRQGRYTFLQGQEKILGRSDLALIGENRWAHLCGSDCDASAANCEIVGAIAERRPIERRLIRSRHFDGSEVWISCSAQPVFDEAGEYAGYRGVDVDVTELTRAQRELEQMALHDPLTGLANRRKFMSRYDLEVARQSRSGGSLSLLLIDIDHFKAINDHYGHLVGDECLRSIANVLSSNLRVVDLIARFGGEEFVVLLCDTGLEQALQIAEQLRRVVAATRLDGAAGDAIGVTVSIGVATRHALDARDFDRLLADADAGAYAAKHAGRDRVCVGYGSASG